MKVVLQDGAKDCGICCLLSIVRYYGGEVSKEYLRKITNTTREGVNLYNLLEASKSLGFDSIGVKGKLEEINVNNLPCIAHININKKYKHFIVIYKMDNKKKTLTVMDPAKGKKQLSYSEYNLLTTNNYLFLKPIKKIHIFRKKQVIYKNVKDLLIKNKNYLILILITTINYFLLNIITSYHFKYLSELVIKNNLSINIIKISLTVGSLIIIKNVLSFIRNIILYKWNSIFALEITTFTYKQILLLPYLYFKNRTSGEVISRFKDLQTVRDYLTNIFCILTTDLISIIIFTTIMIKYSFKLTLIINITFIFISIIILIRNKRKKVNLKKVKNSEDIINSYIIQGINNVDTIKGSHLEKRLIDKFIINYKVLSENVYNYLKYLEKEIMIKDSLKDIMTIIIYSLGSYYVIINKMSLSNLILFQSFISYYIVNYQNIINTISNYNSYKISLERIEELFMIEEENFKNNYFYLPYTLNGNIEIRNLNYSIGTKVIFDNLNLKIKKGEKILLSGESGTGKSTLVKMILRYIETNFDSIKIDNIDINHYHLENIRSNITYVTNNEYLFNETIKNNICMYQEIEEEKLQEIVNMTYVSDLLKDKTLDTIIEENGFNISNGERQRIILARAIIRNSNIYIFDEALSQIDINKEKKILENIFKYMKEKTIIIISHRFNNKKLFDRVLKLSKGKIIEEEKL